MNNNKQSLHLFCCSVPVVFLIDELNRLLLTRTALHTGKEEDENGSTAEPGNGILYNIF